MRRDYRWIEAAISHITAQLSATGAGPRADTLQAALNLDWTTAAKIRFLHGKQFQMKLWEALLRILVGWLKSYGDVAASIAGARRVIKLAGQQQRDGYIFAGVERGVIFDVSMAQLHGTKRA